jgi:plasmid stabilization system protein ParE
MTARTKVRITANFERNLEEIARFLADAEARGAFDALLDCLAEEVVPILERHPDIGRDFLARSACSAEAETRVKRLTTRLAAMGRQASIREYVTAHYLVLYAHADDAVHLLAIRHHRQLSFDFGTLWSER